MQPVEIREVAKDRIPKMLNSFCFGVDDRVGDADVHRNGKFYRGRVSVTTDGVDCQSWMEQWPHNHGFLDAYFPGTGLGSHSECRNPDNSAGPWCFTRNPSIRRAYCDVPSCSTLEMRLAASSKTHGWRVAHAWRLSHDVRAKVRVCLREGGSRVALSAVLRSLARFLTEVSASFLAFTN